MKLKYVLPLVQMTLAAALLRWAYLWQRWAGRIMDMPGRHPAFWLFFSLNGPVAVVGQPLWFREPPANLILITAVGVFWYWVALNIYSWRESRTLLLFVWAPIRVAADLLLIVIGAYLGRIAIGSVNAFPATPVSQLPWPWFIPTWTF